MKEKIILIGGIIAFAIILILASNAMSNPELNNWSNDSEINNAENQSYGGDETLSEEENKESSKVLYVTDSTFEAEVLNSDKIVLIDFYADWCTPCKMLAPTIDEISIERDDVKVVKVNVDANQDEILTIAKEQLKEQLEGKNIVKVIFVPGKIFNIVAK